MSATELLHRLQQAEDGSPLNWQQLREEIHQEHDLAKSTEERVILLGILHAVMDALERSILSSEDLVNFRDARQKEYRLLLVKEALIGENVCSEILATVTEREVDAGRMSPEDSLRATALSALSEPHMTRGELVFVAAVAHARSMLATQLPLVHQQRYDFMPQLTERITYIYLAGVMSRLMEKFGLPTDSPDNGFLGVMSMLVEDGMDKDKAQKYVGQLYEHSRDGSGANTPAFTAGYGATESDGSLVAALNPFRNEPTVSGAPYRLLDRSKPVAIILGMASFAVSLVIDRTFGEAIGIGIVVSLATLGIALAIYRKMIKGN